MSSISPVFNTVESVEPIRPKPDDRINKNPYDQILLPEDQKK